ncbi:BREX-1 system adenine-specific DNA-methyltransferase PglX [Marinilactibacillus psychrotolerans]|uniref:BREX-1 system adenine-specific DNA-methyltransferase PglX n=1 Tax=Marinilactibacillus psychrotolerans TaxID=191770 RepID=UPI003886A1E4
MDKKAIKTFAIESRVKLREGVMNKLAKLGITNKGIEEATKIGNDTIEIPSNGERFTDKEVSSRVKLVDELKKREKQTKKYDIAYDTLVEEVAYTWFNRLIAVRFMEVNDYLPGRQRVLSSEMSGKREPDVITNLLETDLYSDFDVATKERITELLSDGSAAAVDELYQLVFIKLCNSLNKQLPDLFEKIDDYTELLFIISYIDENGVIASLLSIPEDDFNVDKGGQVEIIGWMYQYYNTEPKGKVFARGSRKIRADEIPAATQLFTPDWIVRYMVENSLGRYYIDQKMANPTEVRTEKEIAEEFGWKYYIPTAEQPEDVKLQIADERKDKSVIALQELKLIDPSMGSGHILVYAFDVLMQLYEAEGESPRSAAELIIEKNLFGLDIDKRAFQLAYFALMMKGRQYSRRILSKNIKPNVYAVPDNLGIGEAELQLLHMNFNDQKEAQKDLVTLVDKFNNGADLGSLIEFEGVDFENLKSGLDDDDVSFVDHAISKMVYVGELLQRKYEIVITNPPYMGTSSFNPNLSKFAKSKYPNSKSDLFAMFIERWNKAVKSDGYSSMVTMQSWMFLSSYEAMRKNIISNFTITNMMHMENMVMGIAFGTAVTIFQKGHTKGFKGTYHQIKTSDASNGGKPEIVPIPGNRFNQISQDVFYKIPGSPISYWVSENLIHNFVVGTRMDEIVKPKQGLATANNDRFLREWWEVDINKIKFDATSIADSVASGKKWFPYNKGGSFRRWYGNYDYVVNWENDGYEIRHFVDDKGKPRSVVRNPSFYFKEAITWPLITSGGLSARFREHGSIHDVSGMSAFSDNEMNIYYALGMVNTPIGNSILKILNPTINSQVGDFQNIPVIFDSNNPRIIDLVKDSIALAKNDWNQQDDRWEFKKHPLI